MQPLTNETFRRHGVPADAALYTVAEVARLLRVAVPTVYRWIADGRIESVRLHIPGGERPPVRIPRAAVLSMLEGPDNSEARLAAIDAEASELLEGDPELGARMRDHLEAQAENDDSER